jgi:hypothetical protein
MPASILFISRSSALTSAEFSQFSSAANAVVPAMIRHVVMSSSFFIVRVSFFYLLSSFLIRSRSSPVHSPTFFSHFLHCA